MSQSTASLLVFQTVAGDINVTVANISITEAWHRQTEFTQQWFDAGSRSMVGTNGATRFAALWERLRGTGHLRAYGWLALVIVLGTVAFTLIDRVTVPEFPRR